MADQVINFHNFFLLFLEVQFDFENLSLLFYLFHKFLFLDHDCVHGVAVFLTAVNVLKKIKKIKLKIKIKIKVVTIKIKNQNVK